MVRSWWSVLGEMGQRKSTLGIRPTCDNTWSLRKVCISGVPFQVAFYAYGCKFVSAIIKKSRLAMVHAAVQVSKEE